MHNSSEIPHMMWFILSDDEISGPFSEEHVRTTCDDSSLIWGVDMPEWKSKAGWIHHIENPVVVAIEPEAEVTAIQNAEVTNTSESIAELIEADFNAIESTEIEVQSLTSRDPLIEWYYTSNKEKFGPFNEKELVQMLQMLSFTEPVHLWHKGLTGWEPLESFADIHQQIMNSKAA